MANMRILIDMGLPEPTQEPRLGPAEKATPEEEIRHALDCIESGHESGVEWLLVNKVFRDLSSRKNPTPRMRSLLNMIRPVLSKYGYHGTTAKDNSV